MAVKKEKVKVTKKASKKKEVVHNETVEGFLDDMIGQTVTSEMKEESDRVSEEKRLAKKAELDDVASIEQFKKEAFKAEAEKEEKPEEEPKSNPEDADNESLPEEHIVEQSETAMDDVDPKEDESVSENVPEVENEREAVNRMTVGVSYVNAEKRKNEEAKTFGMTAESLRAKIEKGPDKRKNSMQVYGYNCMGIIYDD